MTTRLVQRFAPTAGFAPVFLSLLLAVASPAAAGFAVQWQTADQGTLSRSFDRDGQCNLAEALDSVKNRRPLHGCVRDVSGDDTYIWLDSYMRVNGQWRPASYKLVDTATIASGAVRIQSSGNGNASIEGTGAAGVFVVRSGATLELRYVGVKHSGTKGRVITNHGNLDMYRAAIEHGDVRGLTGNDSSGVPRGHGGGLYNTGFANLTSTTVQNNAARDGGGIYSVAPVHFDGKIILQGSTVNDNTATRDGGGIYTNTDAILNASTVSTNHADRNGGGILSNLQNYLEIGYSTIAFNSAARGGGVYEEGGGGATRTDYSIVSENVATVFGTDYVGNPHTGEEPSEGNPYTSLFGASDGLDDRSGFDLIGVDSALFPLDMNGAPVDGGTKTHALAPWSWALDMGQLGTDASDQRGFPRYSGGCDGLGLCRADLGAYELQQ